MYHKEDGYTFAKQFSKNRIQVQVHQKTVNPSQMLWDLHWKQM